MTLRVIDDTIMQYSWQVAPAAAHVYTLLAATWDVALLTTKVLSWVYSH